MPLVAENLVKSYSGRRVVDGVSLRVGRGEIVGLLGPNGAGKTTSFYMIIGAIRSEAGRVTLDAEDLASQPMHVRCRKGIGYLAQQPSVFRKLTVRQNLLLVFEMQAMSRRAQQKKADELLAPLKLPPGAHRHALQTLAGVEQRLVLGEGPASTGDD